MFSQVTLTTNENMHTHTFILFISVDMDGQRVIIVLNDLSSTYHRVGVRVWSLFWQINHPQN